MSSFLSKRHTQPSVLKACCRGVLSNFLPASVTDETVCPSFCPQGLPSRWPAQPSVQKDCRRGALPNFPSAGCRRNACPTFCQQGFMWRWFAHLSVGRACRRDGLLKLLSTRLAVDMTCTTICSQGLPSGWPAQLCSQGLLPSKIAQRSFHKACRRDGLPTFVHGACRRGGLRNVLLTRLDVEMA